VGTNARVVRLLKLAQAISSSRNGLAIGAYAKKYGLSRSALYRDLEVLQEFFPIESSGGRHRLPADFRLLGRGGFSADELVALNAMRLLAMRLPGSLMERALQSIWQKLETPALETTGTPRLAAFTTIDYAPYRETISTLEHVVNQRLVVGLRYRRANGVETRRDFEPHALHADAAVEGVYVIGYCRLRSAIRTFAVHRVHHCKVTGEVFAARRDLRTETQLQSAFRAWMSDNPPTEVRLELSAAVARELSERKVHPTQTSEPLPGGRLLICLRVPEPEALVRWIVGLGPDIRVLEPAALREQVASRHRAALREHRPKASVRLDSADPGTSTQGQAMPNARTHLTSSVFSTK
jgi:predicted DNA-binding transcriptional regulator YafY